MFSRSEYWILFFFGLCISASLVQGNAANTEFEDYADDANDDSEEPKIPIITTVPKQIDVMEGDDIRLECRGQHFESYALIWTKLPEKLISVDGELAGKNDSSRYEMLEKPNVLLIKDATLGDAGSYECKILTDITIVHTVTVRARPADRRMLIPYITLDPAGLATVSQDESINLTCTVRTEGKQIEFYWQKKNAQEMKNMRVEDTALSRPSKTTVENKLMLKSVSRHDAGDYVCIFQDDLGKTESTVRLDVRFPPIVETRRDAVHAGLGRSVELRCVVHAVPDPEVTWFRSDKENKSKLIPVRQRDGYHMRSDHHVHILFINNVTQNSFGTYTCEAKNGFTKAGVAKIEVVGAPSQPLLVEERTKLGEEHMSYDLVWKVESSIPIETNALRFKRDPETEWTDIFVEGTRLPNQPSFYEVAYTLVNLTSASTYEATLQSKNTFGWSAEARIHRFSISGKSYTDTMELSDDKGGKAPGLLGSSSLLVSSSIFLFLVRRW